MNRAKKTIALFVSLFAFSFCAFGQTENKTSPPNSPYDAELAKRLGADAYGMKQYVLVILKTGKAKIESPGRRKQLQAGHMKNISRLAEAGKLVLAGPFIEGGELRGIYVFDVKTIDEARELVKTDPAIAEGLFDVELVRWYGSAALLDVNPTHKRIQKNSFEE